MGTIEAKITVSKLLWSSQRGVALVKAKRLSVPVGEGQYQKGSEKLRGCAARCNEKLT